MFKVGDFVKTENGEIGIVGWTENKCMNIKTEDGYIGISLQTGSKGFLAPVKADKCIPSSLNELLKFLEQEKRELEQRLYKNQFNQKLLDEKCKENDLLKKLLAIYINS
jgi:hypothetical protein